MDFFFKKLQKWKNLISYIIIGGYCLFLINIITVTPVSSQPIHNLATNLNDFLEIIDFLSLEDRTAKDKLSKAKESIAVVFIPGVLGSQLIRRDESGTESVIWGQGKPKARELVLYNDDEDPNCRSELLKNYTTFFNLSYTDIYGEFKEKIQAAIAGMGVFHEFSYDWRRDITETAKKLNSYLHSTKELKGRTIILVAHSMGGVVAWEWQSKIYNKEPIESKKLKINRLVLLGAPLLGSCEMFRMLIKGYRPIPDASRFENIATKYLFKDLKPAIFTFPGILQLFPKVSPSLAENCLRDQSSDDPNEETIQRYYQPGFWKDGIGKHIIKNTLINSEALLGMEQDDFSNRFYQALGMAKKFRKNFRPDVTNIQPIIYFSENHQTTNKIFFKKSNDEIKFEPKTTYEGDGRVLWRSATNKKYLGDRVERYRLRGVHGDLPKDRIFILKFPKWLEQVAKANVVFEAARILVSNEHLLQNYINAGGRRVAGSSLASNLGPEASEDIRNVFSRLNTQIDKLLGKEFKYDDVRNILRPRLSGVTSKKEFEQLIPILEQLLNKTQEDKNLESQKVYLLGHLGYALLATDYPKAAVKYLSASIQLVPGIPVTVKEKSEVKAFIMNLYNNLGSALLRSQDCRNAGSQFEEAIAFGNENAITNLGLPCWDRETGVEKPVREWIK